MKNERKIIIFIIAVSLISACTPVADATKETMETPTVVTPTTTTTQTQASTATQLPTTTQTREPTETPTTRPIIPLSELIQNLDGAMKDEVLNIMQERFPLTKEDGRYRFFCVGGPIITHEPAIQLPTGQEISQTIYCQYYDAEGKQQGVNIPIFSYDEEYLSIQVVGYFAKSYEEKETWQFWVDRIKNAYAMEEVATGNSGPNDLTNLDWSGPGHVVYLRFAMPTEEQLTDEDFYPGYYRGYYNEAIHALMSEPQLTKFSQTGDPSLLPQTIEGEALLLPLDISFDNIFGAEQYETRDYDFED